MGSDRCYGFRAIRPRTLIKRGKRGNTREHIEFFHPGLVATLVEGIGPCNVDIGLGRPTKDPKRLFLCRWVVFEGLKGLPPVSGG